MDFRAAPYPPGPVRRIARPRRNDRVHIDDQGSKRRPPVRIMPELMSLDAPRGGRGVEVRFGCEAPRRTSEPRRVGDGPTGQLETIVSFVSAGSDADDVYFDADEHFRKPPYTLETLRLTGADVDCFEGAVARLVALLHVRGPRRRRLFSLYMFFAHIDGGFRWLFSCGTWDPSSDRPEGSVFLHAPSNLPDFRERALCARRLLTEEIDVGSGTPERRSLGIVSFALVDLAKPKSSERPLPDLDPRSCRDPCYLCLAACTNRGVWHVCRGCGSGLLCDGCFLELKSRASRCGACREPWPMRRVDCG